VAGSQAISSMMVDEPHILQHNSGQHERVEVVASLKSLCRHFPDTNGCKSARITVPPGGLMITYLIGPQYVSGLVRTAADEPNTPEGWGFESLRARPSSEALSVNVEAPLFV
jgi:hypothetical protein